MEFLYSNYVNTTTMLDTLNATAGTFAATTTLQYVMDTNERLQFLTDNFDDDSTTTTIRVSFSETLTVGKIALKGINWKDFTVYYNGVTANTFVLTNPTTASDFSENSATSLYLSVTEQACTSVSFDITKTITANQEKAAGHIVISRSKLDFERRPSAKGYRPKISPKEIVHQMSNGGTRKHAIDRKFSADIKYRFISSTFRDDLEDIWKEQDEFIFTPFPTGTSWDGDIFQCIWIGDFDFPYSDNPASAGYDGKIRLRETS